MAISFDLPADTRAFLDDLRDWSVRGVRLFARTADTLGTKLAPVPG